MRDRADNDQAFLIEILDLMHFVAKFRKDTVAEMMSETALEIVEESERAAPSPQPKIFRVEEKTTTLKEEFPSGSKRKRVEEEVTPQAPHQPKVHASQLEVMMQYKIEKPEEKRLSYDSDDEKQPEQQEEKQAEGQQPEEDPDESDDEGGDEEDDFEVDDEQIYQTFKEYETDGGDGYGDLPDSYFNDAAVPINNSLTKKKYVFSSEDQSYHQASFTGQNQKKGPTKTKPLKKPKELIQVPKMKFTKEEKKKLDKQLRNMNNKNPIDLQDDIKAVNKLAFDSCTKSQAKQKLKEQQKFVKSPENRKVSSEPVYDKELTGKELKKMKRKEARAHLQPGYDEGFQADTKEEKKKVPDEKEAKSKPAKQKPGKQLNDQEKVQNLLLFGNPDGNLAEFKGLGDKIDELIKVETKKGKEIIEEKSKPQEISDSKYLTFADINKHAYKYEYIAQLGEEFYEAMEYLNKQELVGFDTEFITKDSVTVATYLQISTLDRGFVINLQNSQFETIFREMIGAFFNNGNIKKIGFSISNDRDAISATFNHEIEFNGLQDMQYLLFTAHSGNASIGLSQLCKRVYGKNMNKEMQKTIAYQKDLVDPVDMEYAALDSLIPLCLYTDLKYFIDLKPQDSLYTKDQVNPNEIFFLLDASCKALKVLLDRCDFGVKYLENLTYKEISEECKKDGNILVTCDKYQIGNSELFPNMMVYYNTKRFKEGSLAWPDFYELTGMELA